ncbi:MAG: hypothetical protein ACK53V_00335, partial [Planctomycetota bacterium]
MVPDKNHRAGQAMVLLHLADSLRSGPSWKRAGTAASLLRRCESKKFRQSGAVDAGTIPIPLGSQLFQGLPLVKP